ncbi:MAG: hypothetical protein QOI47_2268 [Actinomycetota bacterium]|jgi:hypothetical protein|nr:hypothetical protein [Actinomycetota bacterium]
MTDEKTPIEQALDVLLYAPVGLAFSARELLPALAEKGRSQLALARMIGKFAADKGQTDAGKAFDKAFDKARKQAMATLEQIGGATSSRTSSNGASTSNGSTTNGSGQAAPPAPVIDADVVEVPTAPTAPTSGPEAATLAIPDYDSLSASQVLPRLSGLSTADLEAVRAYEGAHRGRKTILNRVAQLASGS